MHQPYWKSFSQFLQVTLFADIESSKTLLPLFQDVAKLFKGQVGPSPHIFMRVEDVT
jgi:hypothetical protein